MKILFERKFLKEVSSVSEKQVRAAIEKAITSTENALTI